MKDDQPNPIGPEKLDLEVSLCDAWEAIGSLIEKINDLVLEQSAFLIALVKTVPGFAQEFERAYKDAVDDQKRSEAELPLSVQRAIRQLRKS